MLCKFWTDTLLFMWGLLLSMNIQKITTILLLGVLFASSGFTAQGSTAISLNSVSINGDYAIVGADMDDNNTGSAYIFRRDGSNWVEEQKLTASDGATDDYFNSLAWTCRISGWLS